MNCPSHGFYSSSFYECPTCAKQEMKIIKCELDKRDRVQSTLEQEGYELDWHQSHYILYFKRKN